MGGRKAYVFPFALIVNAHLQNTKELLGLPIDDL